MEGAQANANAHQHTIDVHLCQAMRVQTKALHQTHRHTASGQAVLTIPNMLLGKATLLLSCGHVDAGNLAYAPVSEQPARPLLPNHITKAGARQSCSGSATSLLTRDALVSHRHHIARHKRKSTTLPVNTRRYTHFQAAFIRTHTDATQLNKARTKRNATATAARADSRGGHTGNTREAQQRHPQMTHPVPPDSISLCAAADRPRLCAWTSAGEHHTSHTC